MKNMLLLCLLLIGVVHGVDPREPEEIVYISTELGGLKGRIWQSLPTKKPFLAFQGLRFAQPPVGPLRFLPPVPWDGYNIHSEIDATQKAPACLQWSYRHPQAKAKEPMIGQEDCLFLNVFVPQKAFEKFVEDKQADIPVMVWIHGGGFLIGSGGPDFYGPHMLMDTQEVIVVTLNYRLGPLGWLSTESDDIAGNMGQKDQIMALKWVQDNIGQFGGDKDKVTIFGESAGAISVMVHVASKESKGLFHRAISQSGPVIDSAPMYLSRPAKVYATAFASDVGCKGEAGQQLLKCLQEAHINDVMNSSKVFERFTFVPNPWKPIVDNYASKPILPDTMEHIFEEQKFNQVPMIIGGNKDEGCLYMIQLMMEQEQFEEVDKQFTELAPMLLFGVDGRDATSAEKKMAKRLLKHYTKDGKFEAKAWKGIRNMLSDVAFLSPIDQLANILLRTAGKNIYYYNYRYRGNHRLSDLYGYDRELGDLGVCHGDELLILFHQESLPKTGSDMKMAEKMAQTWANFAKKGIPHKEWTPVRRGAEAFYAILDAREIRLADKKDRTQFLRSIQSTSSELQKLRKSRQKRVRDEL